MYQELSWLITIALVAFLALIFVIIATSTRTASADYAEIQETVSALRSKLFLLTLLVIIPIIGYTLTKMPYPQFSSLEKATKTIDVIGHQWYWEISDLTAQAGTSILYRVSSADVNHGFAIYDSDLQIIAQTQAMPGYVNELLVTYPEAGQYKILCLEYCGLAHHDMAAEINVSK